MKRWGWIILLCLPLAASTLPEAIEETRRDVIEATEELNRVRDDIEAERLPLAKEISELDREVAALRERVRSIREARRQAVDAERRQQQRLDQLEQERDYIETVLEEFRRGISVRAHAAEAEAEEDGWDPDAPLAERVRTLGEESLARMRERRGGRILQGTALDEEGLEVSGQFAVLGPLAYFRSEPLQGWVLPEGSTGLLGVFPLPDADLAPLFRGEETPVPVDITLGDAVKMARVPGNIVDHLRQGGAVVIPLLILAGLSAVLGVMKAVDLSRMPVQPAPEHWALLDSLDEDSVADALEKIDQAPSLTASLFGAAIRHRHASREHLEEILHEHVLAVVPRLERSLGMLAVCGGVAPLLGLLGTVTGMIRTFQLVTIFGTGNAQTLSGGISEALVTTELGLMVAIPVLLGHAFLARCAKAKLGELEQLAVSVVNRMQDRAAAGP